ncbi:unnamed protein product [Cyprideis torosa]|uniref:Uncharacterized protein n=1 Tax=Cyprideis torosa TaxID=163714 RepID=A0A7R8ZV76_9CRUS|nr:unnamed protein product [Cyprideis torosa]CAG0902000.1 unnamed protein product [Cyprideis torosa]
MNSEVEKEHSAFEILGEDDGYALPKFDGIEVLTDHKESTESGQTAPLTNIVPGSMENKNQTSVASDPIEWKKRFTCGVCGKSLSTKRNLQTHEFIHSGEKPFACRICGKSFAQSGHLTRHKLSHTGEKPFPCRICGKSFAQCDGFRSKTGLHNHGKKHSEGNQFVCVLCEQPFRLVEDLETHLKWHIESDGFRSKSGLNYHERKHSEGDQSTCALCESPTKKTSASIARFVEMDLEASRDLTITKGSTLKVISPLVLSVVYLSD